MYKDSILYKMLTIVNDEAELEKVIKKWSSITDLFETDGKPILLSLAFEVSQEILLLDTTVMVTARSLNALYLTIIGRIIRGTSKNRYPTDLIVNECYEIFRQLNISEARGEITKINSYGVRGC
jgi:hypothetical protein